MPNALAALDGDTRIALGKAAYEEQYRAHTGGIEPWEYLTPDVQRIFIDVAAVIIEAYDGWLAGKADAYADQVANAPTFVEALTKAIDADDNAKAVQSWVLTESVLMDEPAGPPVRDYRTIADPR